jgi:hypothetical protein
MSLRRGLMITQKRLRAWLSRGAFSVPFGMAGSVNPAPRVYGRFLVFTARTGPIGKVRNRSIPALQWPMAVCRCQPRFIRSRRWQRVNRRGAIPRAIEATAINPRMFDPPVMLKTQYDSAVYQSLPRFASHDQAPGRARDQNPCSGFP